MRRLCREPNPAHVIVTAWPMTPADVLSVHDGETAATLTAGIAVRVGVSRGTAVAVRIDVAVRVDARVEVLVVVGVRVGIDDGSEVGVAAGTSVAVAEGVGEYVSAGTSVGVSVGVTVAISVGECSGDGVSSIAASNVSPDSSAVNAARGSQRRYRRNNDQADRHHCQPPQCKPPHHSIPFPQRRCHQFAPLLNRVCTLVIAPIARGPSLRSGS